VGNGCGWEEHNQIDFIAFLGEEDYRMMKERRVGERGWSGYGIFG
jgi:hypothetical protein